MKRIVCLHVPVLVVTGALALWPSFSHSAPKGRMASPPSGKSMAAPPSRAPVQAGRKVTTGQSGPIKRPDKATAVAKKPKMSDARRKCIAGCGEYATQCLLQQGDKKGDGGTTQCMLARTCQARCNRDHPT